ncbi:hypothetical protein [Marinifilum flexuosum]|uniref:hypothetical protein n=1 Tax=Marinifilum flexuosum TaxID=1117708 RepID=UPI0024914F78|nr:hypothetical protein [Marinifilum flexuosum]
MRKFIVIDNDDQEDEIENIVGKAKKDGFNVEGFWFDPTSHECLSQVGDDLLIDKEKIIKQLDIEFAEKSIDLILLDFMLGDAKTDGVDLASYIKKNWRNGRIPLIMFSGDYDKLMEKLSKEWHPEKFEGKFDEQYKEMQEFFKNFPVDTFKRNKEFSEVLVEYLKTIPINMERILLDNLRSHEEKEFINVHPMFEGKKLKEIAKFIERKTGEGEEFKSEIMERAVAHYIHLKE